MRLVATTLSGNSEAIIEDAIRSVCAWVDVCLLIDTGITDSSIERARGVAGEKLLVRRFEWSDDYAAARNLALDAATELGADWAVTVDTDERIQLSGCDVRAELERASEGVLYVPDASRNYVKERFFKLPMAERWQGPIHEAFAAYKVGHRTLSGITFSELAKPPEALPQRFARDVEALTRHSAAHPEEPRHAQRLDCRRRTLAGDRPGR